MENPLGLLSAEGPAAVGLEIYLQLLSTTRSWMQIAEPLIAA